MAESVRDEVRQRRVIEADRAKHRTTIRWMVAIILIVVTVGSFNDRYSAPYATGQGQLILGVLTVLFIAVIAWMRSLAAYPPLPRLLEADRRSSTGAPISAREQSESEPALLKETR